MGVILWAKKKVCRGAALIAAVKCVCVCGCVCVGVLSV